MLPLSWRPRFSQGDPDSEPPRRRPDLQGLCRRSCEPRFLPVPRTSRSGNRTGRTGAMLIKRPTTHFSIVDDKGDAVSNTYTLNIPYGLRSGREGPRAPHNDELDGFRPSRRRQQSARLARRGSQHSGPGKLSTFFPMSPTMVFKDGQLELVAPAPLGGARIMSIGAPNNPRRGRSWAKRSQRRKRRAPIHHQWRPDELRVERGAVDGHDPPAGSQGS